MYRPSSDAKRKRQSEKGVHGFFRYYSSMLYNLNGLERQEGIGTNDIYYETMDLMKHGKLTGCRC